MPTSIRARAARGATTEEPWILGVSPGHNGGACLLHGSRIVAAIQEERLLRMKRAEHPVSKSSLAVQYCLDASGITADDLDTVVVATASTPSRSDLDVSLNPLLQTTTRQIPVYALGNHLAHAVGAFATSGFDRAVVLVVDSSGSYWEDLTHEEQRVVRPVQYERARAAGRGPIVETISIYLADRDGLTPLEKQVSHKDVRPARGMRRFWSLGFMYEAVADQVFGNGLDSAGKVMGLAPYGTADLPIDDFFTIQDGEFLFRDIVPARFPFVDPWPARQPLYQNLAASVQAALEKAVLHLAARAKALSGCSSLCYAGGVALNSVANELIVRSRLFERHYIMPAAEDSGTVIGAAYYGLLRWRGRITGQRLGCDAVGRTYGADDISAAVAGTPHLRAGSPAGLLDDVAALLEEGKIVGWFQGRSELGPRALGQRSILADPRRADMKDLLNSRVKFREAFRPFAPAILREHVDDWFEPSPDPDSPFMLRVLSFRPEKRALVPAVVHHDGTGRVQTLTREINGRFYDLVERFHQRTGVPLLLNTSFNIAGEPIVETPDDALICFLLARMDACVMDDRLIEKAPPYSSPLDLVPHIRARRILVDRNPAAPAYRPIAADLKEAFLYSAPIGRAVDVEQRVDHLGQHVVRIVTQTRWGPVVHITHPAVELLLAQIDGRRTVRDVLDALNGLNAQSTPPLSPEDLIRVVARLRRAAIIGFAHQSSEAALSAVTRVVPAAAQPPRPAAARPAI